jgi:NAD+--asparagine ADP-ribosyltransferase
MIKFYKILILVNKINGIRKSIPGYWYDLDQRNQIYHKGKLPIDSLMNDYIKKKDIEIFSIKREIVKLKVSE